MVFPDVPKCNKVAGYFGLSSLIPLIPQKMGTLIRLKSLGLQEPQCLLDIGQHYYVLYLSLPLGTAVRGVFWGGWFLVCGGCKELIYFSGHCWTYL